MKSIVLIGMPGAGKTTLGTILSRRFKMPFIDTDQVIEEREGTSLQKILEARGLDNFKIFEGEVVASLNLSAHIIATGGSVIYSQAAMTHLARLGTIIYLHVSPAALEERINNADTRGMARRPGMTLAELYKERAPLYKAWADCTVTGDDLSPESMADEIIAFISQGECAKS